MHEHKCVCQGLEDGVNCSEATLYSTAKITRRNAHTELAGSPQSTLQAALPNLKL